MINKKNVTIIDLRDQDDYRKGHIIHSVNLLNIDLDVKTDSKNDFFYGLVKKNDLLVVVCSTGSLSYNLVRRLNKIGFKHVYFLHGGVNNWVYNNLPLVKENS
ncbi:rhodanese-like domain-containing protein [Blochmannia endosymbiont of Camponotus (Colobopsis) obliquus]|uniref:rhodanese-like domain-containing protein n=1 Tax=Blochmannia endosymbiont of Camponotus (Colobopsis) obliquus TaxID=1505597 RepID=UPI00061AE64A|nr:rhodanese-like domain-containing protein [Blochmannia endosymbiont of Camponotus (Colobopsis) obliquus]